MMSPLSINYGLFLVGFKKNDCHYSNQECMQLELAMAEFCEDLWNFQILNFNGLYPLLKPLSQPWLNFVKRYPSHL